MKPQVKPDDDNRFDAIVVGSGIGGLTTASLLAQLENQRVLVLEQHFKIGGFTHTFSRKGRYEWDVGLHYVGQMGIGEPPRAVFDFITGGGVKWNRMPEIYDRFMFPGLTFDCRAGRENLLADLLARFPDEAKAIRLYFRDITKAVRWLNRYVVTQTLGPKFGGLARFARWFGSEFALAPVADYVNRRFLDKKLKAVIMGQWGLYGVPPSQAPFAVHALLVKHYLNGAYYPVGGAAVIAENIVPIIEKHGGKALVNKQVSKILVNNGRAIGVRVEQRNGETIETEEFFADKIISDAGAYTTYTRLLPEDTRLPFEREIREFPNGVANVTLFLGLKQPPTAIGAEGGNIWLYRELDHEEIHRSRNDLVDGEVSHVFLSFPSAKDPEAKGHTAEIIAFVDSTPFAQWEAKPWRSRGEDYEQLKRRISGALIDFVEARLSGFRDLIDYQELSTPITTKSFTTHRNGNIYGLPVVPEKFRSLWLGPHTPIRNLHLTGSDAALFGITGAMISGVLASAVAQDRPWKVGSIFANAIRYSSELHSRTKNDTPECAEA